MLLVLAVLALVVLAVRPGLLSVTVHLVVEPHAVVYTPVAPLLAPLSLDPVLDELAVVLVPVGPSEDAVPMLGTV